MKKLSLSLDDLQVESFATSPFPRRKGTVNGHYSAISECVCSATCPPPFTQQASCVACPPSDATCNGPGCGGNTVMVTCDCGATMNPLDTVCVDASMAGPTCDGSVETCGMPCTYANC